MASPLFLWQRIFISFVPCFWKHFVQFIMEARNRTDNLYTARTLVNIYASICRILKYKLRRPGCNLLSSNNIIFTKEMKTLDTQMGIATYKEFWTTKKEVELNTYDQEIVLWQQKSLDATTPFPLVEQFTSKIVKPSVCVPIRAQKYSSRTFYN